MPNFVWLPTGTGWFCVIYTVIVSADRETEFEDGGSESGDDTVGDKAHGEEGESNEHHDVKGQREQASVDDGDEWEDELDEDEEDEEEDEDEDDDDDDVEMDYAAGVPLFDKAKGSVLLARAGYSPLLGDCGYKSELKELVCGKRGGGNLLDHSIYLRTRESFLSDGSGPNPVLLALGKTEAANCFRGPLLLFGMTKVCDPRFCRDLNAGDFTLAIRALDRANKMSKDPLGTMADALRNLILRR